MNWYALSGLINAVTSIILGLVVYFKNRKENINRHFALFCLSAAVWSSCYFLWQLAKEETTALFWSRALMAGAIFIPICYLHFVVSFLNIFQKHRKLLVFGYLVSCVFLFLDFTPLFVKGVLPELSFQFWPKPGIAFHYFLLVWFAYVIYTTYLLFMGYRQSVGIRHTQIKYILIGMIVGYLGGSTNYLLWYGIPIPPIGNILVVVYVVAVAYAIVKHHLMNIRVILTETLVVAIGIILLIQATLARTLWDIIFKAGILILFSYFGYLLIKAVIREIERRKEVENLAKELKTANLQLRRFDEAKSNFVNIVSHQLRAPVSIMRGNSSMLLEGDYGELTETQKKIVRRDLESSVRLSDLIDTFLNITKIEARRFELRKERVDMEELIGEIAKEIEPLIEKKKLYLKVISSKVPLPSLYIDKNCIRQVIMNLIDNGIKYTEKGGITITMEQVGNEEQFYVKDTGIGISLQEISLLFQKFSRGKKAIINPDGAGIGLFIVRQFVELHGGRVWVKSEGEDKGSVFSFSLPVTK